MNWKQRRENVTLKTVTRGKKTLNILTCQFHYLCVGDFFFFMLATAMASGVTISGCPFPSVHPIFMNMNSFPEHFKGVSLNSKCSPGLIRFGCLKFKGQGHCDFTKHILAITLKIHTLIMTKFHTNEWQNTMIKCWHLVSKRWKSTSLWNNNVLQRHFILTWQGHTTTKQ